MMSEAPFLPRIACLTPHGAFCRSKKQTFVYQASELLGLFFITAKLRLF